MSAAARRRLTVAGVAELLGVAAVTVRSYASRGQMPAPSECPTCGHGPTWPRAVVESWAAAKSSRKDLDVTT